MSDARIPAGEEPDVTAAELALGLLEGDEHAQALRRVLAEPGFAAEVEAWRIRFAQLFDIWPDSAAPEHGVARLDHALDTASVVTPIARGTGRLWPALTAASSLIAACLLLMLLFRPATPPLPPPHAQTASAPMLMAAITPDKIGEPVAAMFDPNSGKLSIATAAMGDPAHSAQLWVIGGDGVPHSLGLMTAHAATVVTLAPENRPRMAGGAVIAVSLEPVGGSPTGLPTGPVIAKGALSQI
jgi:anti-sigma-K factor RskA